MQTMDAEAIETVVVDQLADVERIMGSGDMVPREMRGEWAPSLSGNLVKVICGVRRCGKSVGVSIKRNNRAGSRGPTP